MLKTRGIVAVVIISVIPNDDIGALTTLFIKHDVLYSLGNTSLGLGIFFTILSSILPALRIPVRRKISGGQNVRR